MVSSEGNDNEWSKNIVRITDFAQETAGSFASQYNETAWFPVARDTFSRYMEVWASKGTVLLAGQMLSGWLGLLK